MVWGKEGGKAFKTMQNAGKEESEICATFIREREADISCEESKKKELFCRHVVVETCVFTLSPFTTLHIHTYTHAYIHLHTYTHTHTHTCVFLYVKSHYY